MQFGFMFIALIWKFDFSPFMVLIIAILNDGKILIYLKHVDTFFFFMISENRDLKQYCQTIRNNHDNFKGQG